MSIHSLLDDSDLYTYEYFLQPDICRLCWCRNAEKGISRDGKSTKQSFVKKELVDKIKDCLDLNLCDNNYYPKNICSNCHTKIEKFHEFKMLCQEKDRKLRDIYKRKLNKEVGLQARVKVEKIEDILEDLDLMISATLHSDENDYQHSENDIDNTEETVIKIKKKKYIPKRSSTYCNICRLDFKSVDGLNRHNADSHGIEAESSIFKCFGCERRFKNRKTRLGHEINFCKGLKDGYKCSLCGRFLPKRRMYESHMRDHRHNPNDSIELPEDIFECAKCSQCFKTREHLKNHSSVHDGDKKNFICETCGKVFSRQDYLHKHKLIHTGTKQHVCPHCGFRTTQKSSLTVHIRKHTGERPFSCDVCPQRCISSSNLRAHRARHLGFKNYECKLCDKKFGYKISLEEHVSATHERGMGHQCDLCGAVYSRVRGLRRHLLTKHGKQGVTIRRIEKKDSAEQDLYAKMLTENKPSDDCKKNDNDVKTGDFENEESEVVVLADTSDDNVILTKMY
ncbi:uncharacterized protein ACR2FA_008518 [Aphomia sociella]